MNLRVKKEKSHLIILINNCLALGDIANLLLHTTDEMPANRSNKNTALFKLEDPGVGSSRWSLFSLSQQVNRQTKRR